MGEAKRRGTFEQRKNLAVARDEQVMAVKREIYTRRPSTKHIQLMAMVAGIIGPIAAKDHEQS